MIQPLLVTRRSARRPWFLALLSIVALLTFAARSPRAVSAHAELMQSDPPAQSVLSRPPARVQLFYSEPVEPRSIEVVVLNAQRQPVDQGDAAVAVGAPDAVTLTLNPGLPDGVYTIQWRVTSTVDGHTTRGLAPFTVGDPGAAPATIAPVAGASSGGVAGVIARWLTVLAALALTGSFLFVPAMLLPALRLLDRNAAGDTGARRAPRERQSGGSAFLQAAATPAERADLPPANAAEQAGAAAIDRLLRLCGGLLALLASGAVLLMLVEADVATPGGLSDALGRPLWDWLTDTRRGTLTLIRLALIVAVALGLMLITRLVRARGRAAIERWWPWAALALLGAGMLLVQSLGSHSAALRSGEGIATTVDFVHLLAVALWVGGLIQFGLAVLPALAPLGGPPRTRLLAGLIPRFSLLAGAGVAVIVVTGIYQTVRLLGGISALTDQAWGRSLLVKLALFVPLLGLAAFNLLVVRPRLTRLAGRMDRAARETAAALRTHFRRALLAEAALAAVILLVVGVLIGNSPGRVATDLPAGPFRPFILDTEAEGMRGTLTLSPGRVGLNRFDLNVATAARQAVSNDSRVVLRISTLDQDTGIAEATTRALGGGRFTTTGSHLSTVGFWEVAAIVRRPNGDEVRLPFQFSLTSTTGQIEARQDRPAAPLERGRELFQNNCIQCHGAAGRGDGPLAAALQPRPVDLTVHVPQHGDQALVDWITNGVARTAMPAFGGTFTPEEIQAIVNYLRQLAEQSNQSR